MIRCSECLQPTRTTFDELITSKSDWIDLIFVNSGI